MAYTQPCMAGLHLEIMLMYVLYQPPIFLHNFEYCWSNSKCTYTRSVIIQFHWLLSLHCTVTTAETANKIETAVLSIVPWACLPNIHDTELLWTAVSSWKWSRLAYLTIITLCLGSAWIQVLLCFYPEVIRHEAKTNSAEKWAIYMDVTKTG